MQAGLLILGDHLPDPNTGEKTTSARRHRQIVDLAVRGEALGFDSLWLGEHHFCDYVLSSPAVVLAAVGERTRSLRLGTAVSLLTVHDPVKVAEEYSTLDALSAGRVELVVGRGLLRRTYADFGRDIQHSREMLVESLELLIRLWTEERVTWTGKWRAPLDDLRVEPRPLQRPHPPLWVAAGTSSASAELAGRLGVGLMLPVVMSPPEGFKPFVEQYREAFARAGHDTEPRVAACSHVHVAGDASAARERWRPHHMSYIRWVLRTLFPWGGINISPDGGMLPVVPPRFEELIAGPAICGSPGEAIDRIRGMRESLGLDLHIGMFDHGALPEPLLEESLALFGSEVLPAVRAD